MSPNYFLDHELKVLANILILLWNFHVSLPSVSLSNKSKQYLGSLDCLPNSRGTKSTLCEKPSFRWFQLVVNIYPRQYKMSEWWCF